MNPDYAEALQDLHAMGEWLPVLLFGVIALWVVGSWLRTRWRR